MKESMHVQWLYRQLPELLSQGVIEPQAAENIHKHYGEPETTGGKARRRAIVLFSILGAVLIGGGIILLLAHNWEELSREMRAVIAIAPLAVTAALGAWLLWREKQSTAWREGVGTAQTLAIGSSIALVAQTYNIGGLFDEFMLTWSLLALPIAYLLRSTFPALLYLVGITIWTGSVTYPATSGLWYFPMLGAALPFLWWTGRANRYHPRPVLVAWVLAITVCIGTGLAVARMSDEMHTWPVLFSGLFVVLYLVGSRWWGQASAAWQRPLQTVGALGAVGLALVLSFGEGWPRHGWLYHLKKQEVVNAGLQLALAGGIAAAALALWARSFSRKAWDEVMLGAVAALVVLCWTVEMIGTEAIRTVLFNVYLLVLGIGTLVIGLRGRALGKVNAGMSVLAALILCRFFDSELDFLLRGAAFIVIGIGFLITNLVLLRWKGAANG